MNTNTLLIYLVILFLIAYLMNTKEKFIQPVNHEPDLKNGYIGKHPNILKKDKNRKYHITSKYDFNITASEKKELRRIVNPIIRQINKNLNLEFNFLNFEHVTTQYFKNKNKRFIIDFFIHETNKYYDKRLIADVLLYSEDKTINVINLSIGNGMIEKTSDNLAIPDFDTKIISDSNLKNSNTVIGNENNALEYKILKDKPLNFINTNRNFTEWILKEDLPEQKWPCREQNENWNSNGILETQSKTDDCKGINNTFREQKQKPKFYPSFKEVDSESNYNWLWGSSSSTGNMFSGGSN